MPDKDNTTVTVGAGMYGEIGPQGDPGYIRVPTPEPQPWAGSKSKKRMWLNKVTVSMYSVIFINILALMSIGLLLGVNAWDTLFMGLGGWIVVIIHLLLLSIHTE